MSVRKPASHVAAGDVIALTRLFARDEHDHIPHGREFTVAVNITSDWPGYMYMLGPGDHELRVRGDRELTVETQASS